MHRRRIVSNRGSEPSKLLQAQEDAPPQRARRRSRPQSGSLHSSAPSAHGFQQAARKAQARARQGWSGARARPFLRSPSKTRHARRCEEERRPHHLQRSLAAGLPEPALQPMAHRCAPSIGKRHNLHRHRRRLPIPLSGERSSFTQDSRLARRREPKCRRNSQSSRDGDRRASRQPLAAPSFGQRKSVLLP
ncbi:MAG: hypothetical protein ACI92G_000916 [Candidatus Pelagisphaera sp.]|jgi:hypothetical protein